MTNKSILIKFTTIGGLDLYEAYDEVKNVALRRGEVVETVFIPSREPGPYLLNEFKNDPRCVNDPLKKDSLGNSVITMSDEIPNYIVYIKVIASRINSYPSNSRVNGLKCLSFSEYKDSLLPGHIFVGTVINTYNDGVIWQYASNDLEDLKINMLAGINSLLRGNGYVRYKDISQDFVNRNFTGGKLAFGYKEVPLVIMQRG